MMVNETEFREQRKQCMRLTISGKGKEKGKGHKRAVIAIFVILLLGSCGFVGYIFRDQLQKYAEDILINFGSEVTLPAVSGEPYASEFAKTNYIDSIAIQEEETEVEPVTIPFISTNNEEEKDDYLVSKEALISLLETLCNGNAKDGIYFAQKEIVPLIKTKEEMRFFVDMLSEVYEDLLNIKCNREISLKSYDTMLTSLADKLPHIELSLSELLKQRNLVNLNVNIALQIDHLILYLVKE